MKMKKKHKTALCCSSGVELFFIFYCESTRSEAEVQDRFSHFWETRSNINFTQWNLWEIENASVAASIQKNKESFADDLNSDAWFYFGRCLLLYFPS